ncbi:RtcB family protein [Nitrosomonas sp. Nm34]|uniref:RtcB family protein n=1 Tax=Nitrosomonas sp. Nm34 TaxID=1881055 RepID=UPI0008E3D45E|nr:RtcB family protein [Nitrosomonas sp. Nm34]SFI82496.1 tRNA-splicing ligase RtcB [Nitrosomonas sp. Nm34]
MTVKKVLRNGVPVKIWTEEVDQSALDQLSDLSKLPFIHKHIAVMPDVHAGTGSTIGSVIPTKGAIIPAAVGVDIGCGMMAVKTSLKASMLPDNLYELRSEIEKRIPHGRTNNGGSGDRGAWSNPIECVSHYWNTFLADGYEEIIAKYPKAKGYNTINHLGTLGTGNHFIEICIDESDYVWAILHSGSRGVGNRIGSYFIEKAKEEIQRYFIQDNLPNKDLAYLVEHTEIYNDYVNAVSWAQRFAELNRRIMMDIVLQCMSKFLPSFTTTDKAINCHHNYVARENHFGANVFVTRKGAIRARKGDLGIIPGSMGAKSYIVEGLGNEESFHSCSHGAGRRLGRNEAKRIYTVADLEEQTKGIECPKDEARIDEIPAAYKDIDQVMENQWDLVKIKHTLKQVLNVKG